MGDEHICGTPPTSVHASTARAHSIILYPLIIHHQQHGWQPAIKHAQLIFISYQPLLNVITPFANASTHTISRMCVYIAHSPCSVRCLWVVGRLLLNCDNFPDVDVVAVMGPRFARPPASNAWVGVCSRIAAISTCECT